MITVYPPPVAELVDKLRNFIEWELWYRERMHKLPVGVRGQKIQEAEDALVALEQLGELARRGSLTG